MHDWKEVDLVIGRLARQRSGQDYEEGLALIAAKRTRAYAHFGFGSLVEYIERRLGYDPRTTNERLRVAEALEILPKTADALRAGEIRWSTARELTRIAQPETEAEWLVAARAKTLREIERLVAGLRPGDRPGAPSDPEPARATQTIPPATRRLVPFRRWRTWVTGRGRSARRSRSSTRTEASRSERS